MPYIGFGKVEFHSTCHNDLVQCVQTAVNGHDGNAHPWRKLYDLYTLVQGKTVEDDLATLVMLYFVIFTYISQMV